MTLMCSDCGKPIYANDEEESVGGKHAALWEDSEETPGNIAVRFICMPCSSKYEEITPQIEGVREEVAKKIEDLENKSAKKD